jgi:hypothetical protein
MPQQYAIYKGVKGPKQGEATGFGALQVSLKPHEETGEFGGQEGVVFINACSSTGSNQYDWSNKFVFALGLTDIGKLLHFFVSAGEKESLNLVHDPDKGKEKEGTRIKSMSIYTNGGCLNGAMITCSIKQGGDVVSHKIPISGDEVMVLKCLLETAVPAILGWS